MDSLQYNDMTAPKAVEDLNIFEEKFLGKHKYFLISDEREKYLKLNQAQYNFYKFVMKYLDGKHSMAELDTAIKDKVDHGYDADKVISILFHNNLLDERASENKTKVEIELSSKKVVELTIDQVQDKHRRFIGAMDLITQCIGVLAIVSAIILILFNQDLVREVYRQTKLFSWKEISVKDFLFLMIFSFLSIPIHEIGHLLAANRYHVRWKQFIFALKWGVNPVYYIRYYNFYSNKSKNKILILLSGVYFNIIQAAIYFILLVYTYDWRMAVLSIVNLGCVVSCLLPSGTSDGYHIVSILMDIEGIRWKMLKMIAGIIKEPRSILKVLKEKQNIALLLYFTISYTLAIYGCYVLLNTIIDYLHIFSADQYYATHILSIGIAVIVFVSIVKFIKNLKNI